MSIQLYRNTAFRCSSIITEAYSTSFSLGIRSLHKRFRNPIYGIYGFVRTADEIVDTFHGHDQERLLGEYRQDTWRAIERGISTNPVLQAFQEVVHQYDISYEMIDAFLRSMEMDLEKMQYERKNFEEYIYGSAEVVGLMCLKIFTEGNENLYEELKAPARSLGAAFQKINFLRDIQADFQDLGRMYFPGVDWYRFDNEQKARIEKEIEEDFGKAYSGIVRLPKDARLGVYLAYVYYLSLFKRIKRTPASRIMQTRVRVPDKQKLALFVQSYFRNSMNWV